MKIIKTKAEMRAWSLSERSIGHTIAFVPTMGYLHDGHLALVRAAKADQGSVAVSIYVNPTQFGPQEDFSSYPRDLARDAALLEKEGVDVLFTPETLYDKEDCVMVDPGPMQNALCGRFRPNHFRGVATVVLKLFNLVVPHSAFFGQKDAQQVAILKKMIADFDLPVRLRVVPIIREADGLALSSRNIYLSSEERRKAPSLYQALCHIRRTVEAGETDAVSVLNAARSQILADIDYLEAVEGGTLQPASVLQAGVLIAGAIRLGRTRLIDNMLLS
ncbi:MAG: pantoate--beta-alanine ligase [Elusimicrobia bacterium RIFOXYB2_FULL_49_7]|nr:MAG: pantoate--beta-alanine ligase [Elusimicrobia bacterium RIFOXYB2_FULL_49_7]